MNNIIVVAEDSKTLSKVICSVLRQNGFEPVEFNDGVLALEYILKSQVKCVISNVILKNISGKYLYSIIKNGSSKSGIPFLLYTTDAELKESDDCFYLNSNNVNELIISIQNKINDSNLMEEILNEDISQEQNSIICAVNAMEKQSTNSFIMDKIIYLENFINNIDLLAEESLKVIYSICKYDEATLILNTNPSRLYFARNSFISKENNESFLQICMSEYAQHLHVSNRIEYDIKEIGNFFISNNSDEAQKSALSLTNENELKSFNTFVIENNNIIGTLHIASKKRKFFSYKIISALHFFSTKIGTFLQHSIEYNNLFYSEKRMHNAFTKFVPEEIIQEMIKNDDSKNSSVTEKRKVAIMVCDIRNFTTLSELNKPENVVGFLNGYFTRMVDIIKNNGGSIDKFMGDAIMANFGAPISYSDNSKRAVDAAIQMISALDEIPTDMLTFNEKVPSIEIGIGIHYGEVIVGNIGCKDKTDYTVIGDSANLASRLEGLTKQYGAKIIISSAVLENMEESLKKDSQGNELKEIERKQIINEYKKNYNFIQLDKVKVKGKHLGIEIFRTGEKQYSAEYKESYEKALSLYFNGNFNFAREYFNKAKKICPQDKASELLINICEKYEKSPPENWDGARELTSK